MKARHATALAFLGWYLTLPLQARAKSSTLTLRQALLPVPNVMNESAYPAKFKPAPLNVVLHHYISLPGWVWLGLPGSGSVTCPQTPADARTASCR